jgi:hypothetical protein
MDLAESRAVAEMEVLMRLCSRKLAIVASLLLGAAGAAGAQTITAGNLPGTVNFGFNPNPVVLTAVDLSFPATGAGEMTSATFLWSLAPCAMTVKIKFFRRSGDTLIFLAERGPFDVNGTTQAVALTPSVPVLAGDLVGITRVAGCGSPVGVNPGALNGLVAYPGDISTSVSISSGTTAPNSTLAVQATGSAADGGGSNPAAVIPVAISSPGQLGANFRTAAQLYNPSTTAITGKLVFHAQGVSGSASDPSLPYSLTPGQTTFLGDVVAALAQTGIGSLDIVPSTGALPVASIRVYNDGGVNGTTGFTEQEFKPAEALSAGNRGVIVGPFDPLLYRLNIGVRTLATGATINITVRASTGTVLKTLSRSYAPNFFEQTDATSFVGGLLLAANQTITVDVVQGSLFIYGATADNRTNDPALDFAKSVI